MGKTNNNTTYLNDNSSNPDVYGGDTPGQASSIVTDYLSGLGSTPDPYDRLSVESFGASGKPSNITNSDYYPSLGEPLQVGNYQGSQIGSVPIFTSGTNVMPFGILEKRRDALQAAAAEYMQKALKPLDFSRKPLKNELLADKLNSVYIDKINYFMDAANKISPTKGWELIRAGKAGKLSEDWFKFRNDMNTWSSQFDNISDYATQLSAFEEKGGYVPEDARKAMNDVREGLDNVEEGVMSGNAEELAAKMKGYTSIPQITTDILNKVVLSQKVEYVKPDGTKASQSLQEALNAAASVGDTKLITELQAKYLGDENLDMLIGNYVKPQWGRQFYGTITSTYDNNGVPTKKQEVIEKLNDAQVMSYDDLKYSLKGLIGTQYGMNTQAFSPPGRSSVTVNNIPPSEVDPTPNFVADGIGKLYGDNPTTVIGKNEDNYAVPNGLTVKFVINGKEEIVSINDKETIIKNLGRIGTDNIKDSEALYANVITNPTVSQYFDANSKTAQDWLDKPIKTSVVSFKGKNIEIPTTKDANGNIVSINTDAVRSPYNLLNFANANNIPISVSVYDNQTQKTSDIKIVKTVKVGDGYQIETSTGLRGVLMPSGMVAAAGGTDTEATRGTGAYSSQTPMFLQNVYYSGIDNLGKTTNYILKKVEDGSVYKIGGESSITVPQTSVLSYVKDNLNNQFTIPYNKLKVDGVKSFESQSFIMTPNQTGDEQVSIHVGNEIYNQASFNNIIENYKSLKGTDAATMSRIELVNKTANAYLSLLLPENNQSATARQFVADGTMSNSVLTRIETAADAGKYEEARLIILDWLSDRQKRGDKKSYYEIAPYFK
jgi:hypothetical protein